MAARFLSFFFCGVSLLVAGACSSEKERISCITALDCPLGQTCENGFCVETPDQTVIIDKDEATDAADDAVDADENGTDDIIVDEQPDTTDALARPDEDEPVSDDAADDMIETDDPLFADEDTAGDEVLAEVDEVDDDVPPPVDEDTVVVDDTPPVDEDETMVDDEAPVIDEDTVVEDEIIPDEDTLIDECTVNDNPCNDHGDTAATCTDEQSGYTCNCTFGFDPTLGGCHDIDECTAGTDTCAGNENCTNTLGGFTCALNFCGDGERLAAAGTGLLLPFNEGSGTTAGDLSGNGNHASLNGTAWSDGRFGKGLSFDGSTAVSIAESASLKAGAQMTVTAWIKSSVMPSNYVTIVQKDGVGLRNYGLFITGADQPATQGTVLFSLTSATPGDWRGPTSSISVIDGLWHHLAGVYNGVEMKIFIDGVERGAVAVDVAPADTDAGVSIGGGFAGLLDEVRLYHRALGSAEIAELANRRVHLPFEESGGTIAFDLSGNARNGTLHNAVTRTVGRFGGGLFFDGVDDALQWDYDGAPPVNNFTMMAWFTTTIDRYTEAENTTTTSGTRIDNHYLFWPDNKDTEAGAGVSVGTNGISVYEHGNAYMPPLAVYDSYIGTGWNHVAVTYTDRQPRIYLNGVLVREGLVSPKSTVYAPQFAGVTGGFYGTFSGNADDIRIYDRPLNAVEITAIMQNSYHDEQCDDGNFDNGDGCSTACLIEPLP